MLDFSSFCMIFSALSKLVEPYFKALRAFEFSLEVLNMYVVYCIY